MLALKPFDITVALKIGLNEKAARLPIPEGEEEKSPANSVGDLADCLFKAKGDVSRAIRRLVRLGLVAERPPGAHDITAANRKYYSVQRNALADLLCFAIRYIFAPERTGYGRGVPTGWNCPLIKSAMNPPEIPLVWALPGGEVSGELIEPLYAKCPQAALADPGLYELLSLIEVIRTGKPREVKYAKDLIRQKVAELHS